MSRAVIINEPKRPARSLIVAHRMPRMGERTGTGLFDATGDVVFDCDTEGCGWGCAGPRGDVREAVAAHNRMFHSQATGPLVGVINNPKGRL